MEKRVLWAVLLSIAVMYGYSFLVTPPSRQKNAQMQRPVQQQLSAAKPVAPIVQAPEMVENQPVKGTAIAAPGKDVVVETDLYTAVFSSSGASLRKFLLKKYTTTTAPDAKPIALIDEKSPENFSLKTEGSGLPIDPAGVYSVNADALKVAKGEKKSLEFVLRSNSGDYVKKTYTFSGDGYGIALDEQVGNTTGFPQQGSLLLVEKNHFEPIPGESRYDVHGPTTFADNALQTQKFADLAKGTKTFSKGVLWSGFEDKYFLGAAIGVNSSIATVQIKQKNAYVENVISSPQIALAPGASATVSYRLYFGPKDLDILKAQGNRLEEVIDLGWFSAIAKPLLHILKFFYKYTGNYGVAIIIITVIIKALFYPLTSHQFKSMKDMQKLQPKMAELKEKYKNDRDAMNRAVMELYKTHKVNPMGGCLPMVIQIPVFFALYKALMFSIELRHAHFFLWIKDLSAPDALFGIIPKGLPLLGGMPLGPLPLLMGATMVIQQKMTPSNMDPAQARIMMALPFIFTFMFLNFPSGLVLYWLVNNVLTIVQQAFINKKLKD
ncbi:MAG TPA: membrane protein insertase YidC [Geobacteraceae bacterium]